ncbi:MAG TPA: PASTA domain-containing protein [Bacteroidota bacterium]|nr:PASTA domain-containing protein [Bacteroidota bacterium]
MTPAIQNLLKRLGGFFAGLLVLFILVDDVVMPWYVQQGRTTTVPDVTGLPKEEAFQKLSEHGLVGKEFETRQDKQYPIGTVAQQNPLPGTEVKYGRGIYLTISGGEPKVSVPSLRGRSLRDAALALERFGLSLGRVEYQVSMNFPENTIIEQGISEETKVPVGTQVSVIVSQGKSADRIPVPNVVRKSLTEAEKIILQLNLKVGNITFQPHPDLLPNTVIEQFPRPGNFVSVGQAIDLFVAQKPEKRPILEN